MQRLFTQLIFCFVLFITSWGAFAGDPIFFTVMGAGGQGVLRWLTSESSCPTITWDNQSSDLMTLRAGIEEVPIRTGIQSAQKPSKFDLSSCEAVWPNGVSSARIEKISIQAPKEKFRRIVLIADTGCRMKGSEGAFQDCNDKVAWPFEQVAMHAAQKTPDLVIHIGDIHYRESPCPDYEAGCQKSAWGYGSDAWEADLFTPAKALLQSTPWVFVRGNHETCARAGQGWFRYIESSPWIKERSCDLVVNDDLADFTRPYTLALDEVTQLVIFDSSATSGKPLNQDSAMFKTYRQQFSEVNRLTANKQKNIFLSHHPLLAVAPGKAMSDAKAGGNQGLMSVMKSVNQSELVPVNTNYLMHGHIHAFEALNFKGRQPASFVLGNSGSMMEGALPQTLPTAFEVAPNFIVEKFTSHNGYGFALLEIPETSDSPWKLSEFDMNGHILFTCMLDNSKSTCKSITSN
jgi:Calcineurin-like phosphoesterase